MSAWIVTVAMVLTVGSTAESQTRVSEQKLRIRTLDDPSTVTEAWYVGQTADTLYVLNVLTPPGGQPEAVPFERIRTLERYRGMKWHMLQGMAVGLGVGAIASLALSSENCGGSNQDDVASCFGQGMVLLGVPGVVFGALVGALWRTERWEKVPTHPVPVHVGFLPGSRVVVVGLSFGI
jgi:hypothetical protein